MTNLFLSQKLSKRLEELGAKSESGFWWRRHKNQGHKGIWALVGFFEIPASQTEYDLTYPAFHLSDFLLPCEQSRENCRLVCGFSEGKRFWELWRRDLLEAETPETAIKIIEESIKGR